MRSGTPGSGTRSAHPFASNTDFLVKFLDCKISTAQTHDASRGVYCIVGFCGWSGGRRQDSNQTISAVLSFGARTRVIDSWVWCMGQGGIPEEVLDYVGLEKG